MGVLANVLVGLVALSHVGFLVLEMFLWDHPVGRKVFRLTPELSASTAALAANQGLYNGSLAAGLVWALPAALALGASLLATATARSAPRTGPGARPG